MSIQLTADMKQKLQGLPIDRVMGVPMSLWAKANPDIAGQWMASAVLGRAKKVLAEHERHIAKHRAAPPPARSPATTRSSRPTAAEKRRAEATVARLLGQDELPQAKTRADLRAEIDQARRDLDQSGLRHEAPNDPRWRAAIHEAGHAVIGMLNKVDVFSIDTTSTQDNDGQTGWTNDGSSSPEARALMAFSGAAAESKLTGQAARMSSSDVVCATDAVRQVARNKLSLSYNNHPMWSKWQDAAKQQVDRHWSTIESVARETIAQGGSLPWCRLFLLVKGRSQS